MNKIYLAAVTGAALTAFAGIANAQGTGTSSGSTGTASNQCWDLSSGHRRRSAQEAPAAVQARGSSASVRPAGMSDC